MRFPLLLYGMATSALIHGACIPLVLWVAEDEQALRLPGRRVAVHMTLEVRPGPPPSKVRGPLPRNGLNIKPGEKLTGEGKVARNVTAVPNPPPPAPAQEPVAKPEPKPVAKSEPKPERKQEPKPEPKPERRPEPKSESKPKRKPALKPAPKTLQPVIKKIASKQSKPKPPSNPSVKTSAAFPAARVKADLPPPVAATSVDLPPPVAAASVAKTESSAAFKPEAKPEAAPPPPKPHAISLYPDAPTRRGRKGASDAQMLGTDETLPRFGQNRPPIYPPEAVSDRREGTVLLRLYVTTTGRVTNVEVARSSGSGVLDEAAVDAVRTWTGVPRTRYGRAIESVELLPVVFTLR